MIELGNQALISVRRSSGYRNAGTLGLDTVMTLQILRDLLVLSYKLEDITPSGLNVHPAHALTPYQFRRKTSTSNHEVLILHHRGLGPCHLCRLFASD